MRTERGEGVQGRGRKKTVDQKNWTRGVLQSREVRTFSLTKGSPNEHLVIGHQMANQQFSVSSKKTGGMGKYSPRERVQTHRQGDGCWVGQRRRPVGA